MQQRALSLWSLGIALTLVLPVQASAQGVSLSQLLPTLIQDTSVLSPTPPPFLNHQAHFQTVVPQELSPFNQEILTQVATVPIGSSSGGFAWTFNPSVGTRERVTDSFGPSFAERALTGGKGVVTFGMNLQHSSYNEFNGLNLGDGSINFYLQHAQLPAPCPCFFEGDLVQASLQLKLSTAVATAYASYGLTDRLDVSVIVPLVHVSMDATVNETILRLATSAFPTIHAFPVPACSSVNTCSGRMFGSATGLGDIEVRGKYRLMQSHGGGLAVEVDGRLPTGDATNLLGAGAGPVTFALIASTTQGAIATHANVGYTASGTPSGSTLPNEFGYRGGVEWVAHPRVTLAFDILGRSLLNTDHLVAGPATFNFMNGPTTNVVSQATFNTLNLETGSLNEIYGAFGGKFNLSHTNLLISANVLIPFTKNGITAGFTPVVGFDYTF